MAAIGARAFSIVTCRNCGGETIVHRHRPGVLHWPGLLQVRRFRCTTCGRRSWRILAPPLRFRLRWLLGGLALLTYLVAMYTPRPERVPEATAATLIAERSAPLAPPEPVSPRPPAVEPDDLDVSTKEQATLAARETGTASEAAVLVADEEDKEREGENKEESTAVSPQPPPATISGVVQLSAIAMGRDSDGLRLRLTTGSEMMRYRYFSLDAPPRFVIDLPEVLAAEEVNVVARAHEVKGIRYAQRGDRLRLVLDLAVPALSPIGWQPHPDGLTVIFRETPR